MINYNTDWEEGKGMFPPRQPRNNMRPFPPQGMTRRPPHISPHPMQGGNYHQGGLQGLLQRFLQPKGQTGYHGFPGGQGFQAAQHGDKFAGMLGNVQQAIKLAQTATPLIQQYGPMVKNIPMMINLMKALNEDDTETISEETAGQEKKKVQLEEETLSRIETDVQRQSPHLSSKGAEGVSKPKLFI